MWLLNKHTFYIVLILTISFFVYKAGGDAERAKMKKHYERQIAETERQHKRDLELARKQIKKVEVIRYKTRTIIKEVENVKVHSCPKLPSGFVQLYNRALKD